jgi:hypothetical protein
MAVWINHAKILILFVNVFQIEIHKNNLCDIVAMIKISIQNIFKGGSDVVFLIRSFC